MPPLFELFGGASDPQARIVAAGADILAAAVLGATGSFHCFLMCGPLACAGAGAGRQLRLDLAGAYHGARIAAYALTGGLLGLLGGGAARALSVSLRPIAPWLLVAALVATALDLGRRLRPIPGVARASRAAAGAAGRLSPGARAAALGALTPLLPCGLLYGAFAAAVAAGSFASGALLLGAFGLGAAPALGLAQLQVRFIGHRSPRLAAALHRLVPLVAAAVLVYRTVAVGGGHSCH